MAQNLIVKSEIKNFYENNQVADDLYKQLNVEVAYLLERAAKRAEQNGRRRVMAKDL